MSVSEAKLWERIQQAWQRLAGFATCDAGPDGYRVTIKYQTLQQAQDAYSAIHDIGKVLTEQLTSPAAPSPEVKPFTPTKSTWQAGKEFKAWIARNTDATPDKIAEKALKIFSECGTAQPEVIEGRGQSVGDKAGWYWCYPPEWANGNSGVLHLEAADRFTCECRFIRVTQPVLQPRPAFVAPERPDTLIRQKSDGFECWASKRAGGYCAGPWCYSFDSVDVINPATGEPLAPGWTRCMQTK